MGHHDYAFLNRDIMVREIGVLLAAGTGSVSVVGSVNVVGH